jgi:type II secretory pathway component HofQ
VWVDGKEQKIVLPLPITRTRQMQTTVAVPDGQTLVLGNPIQTVVRKQPNGQSVTSTSPENIEKRLLVFVTPTVIDPAGNPIHNK